LPGDSALAALPGFDDEPTRQLTPAEIVAQITEAVTGSKAPIWADDPAAGTPEPRTSPAAQAGSEDEETAPIDFPSRRSDKPEQS
jgi:hypothetical protein